MNLAFLESQIYEGHCTATPSFQIANVHPPTVRMMSLKKGDLCRVVMGPSCAAHTCSGRGAEKKNATQIKQYLKNTIEKAENLI